MSVAICFLAKVKPHEQLRERQLLIMNILINTTKMKTRNFVPTDALGFNYFHETYSTEKYSEENWLLFSEFQVAFRIQKVKNKTQY